MTAKFNLMLLMREPLLFAIANFCFVVTAFFVIGQWNSWVWHQQILPVVVWLPLLVLLLIAPVGFQFRVQGGKVLGNYQWLFFRLGRLQVLGTTQDTLRWHQVNKSLVEITLSQEIASNDVLFRWRVGGRISQRIDHKLLVINEHLGLNLAPYNA